MESLYQRHVKGLLRISRMAKLATHFHLEKLNSNKTKLKAFFPQLNLKL